MPTTDGFTACHTSTNGWPVTSTCGPATACAARVSLLPSTRWSTSTPSRRCGAGPELGDGGGEVVHAVHRLDDDALDPQVVPPHPSRRARRRGCPRPRSGSPGRCGRSGSRPSPSRTPTPPALPAPAAGTTSVAGRPSTRNAAGRSGNTRRRPCRSSRVTSRTSTAHHRAAEPAGRVLDDDPALGGDLGDLPLADDPPAVGAERAAVVVRPGGGGTGSRGGIARFYRDGPAEPARDTPRPRPSPITRDQR